MSIPSSARYLVIGAGVHGLSTAYHLALDLKARRRGPGSEILVIDKSGIGAGASGIACGVIRNNYFQPAMRELMAHSVEVWESDREAYSYHPIGYLQISPEAMHADLATVYEQQQMIGYPSEFVEGEADCQDYMETILYDWQAKGTTSILHEKKGGYANNMASMQGLARKAENEGVKILSGVEVMGFQFSGESISAVETSRGTIQTDYVIVGVGPWVKSVWEMLELPGAISIRANGKIHSGVKMWTYWCLQEGTLGVDPGLQKTNDGRMPPVIHFDCDQPLYDYEGKLIRGESWGIYYKPDFHFGGIQGGAMPTGWRPIRTRSESIPMDPSPLTLSWGKISLECGVQPWLSVRSASREPMSSTKMSPVEGWAPLLPTASPSSTCFARTAT